MKKGFTLIELLAVILILGVIAMIAVPQVTNTIEKSKKGAAETSAKHYIDAVNNAIGLNQLDEDSSNDIEDGTYSVSQLTVDISGEEPDSGTVTIENGGIKSANFTINGYTVTCTGKGKCTAEKENYVYFQEDDNFDNPNQIKQSRPTNYDIYIKVNKNDHTKLQSCIYDNGTEFCLKPNEYEISVQKIKVFFGFDENTWTLENGEWEKDDKYCLIDYASPEAPEGYKITECRDEGKSIEVHVDTDNNFSRIKSSGNTCGACDDGRAYCSFKQN